jgi:hypothetical protein
MLDDGQTEDAIPSRGGWGRAAKLPGYIYFIQCESTENIKIGFSANHPDTRLAAIQSTSPGALRRLGYLRGSRILEQRLHKSFKKWRLWGEWFAPGPEIIAYIQVRGKRWSSVIKKGKGSALFARARELASCDGKLKPLPSHSEATAVMIRQTFLLDWDLIRVIESGRFF